MSFFDDEPEQTTRVNRPARPRRTATARAPRAPEPDVVARRRLVLFAGLAVIALLMILLIRSCASNSHKNALKDYNRNVASIVASSDGKVSRQLFDVLGRGGQSQDVQVAIQQVRLLAEEDATRAKSLSVPGDAEAQAAQHDFELTMNLRAAGVRKIAEQLPRAMSNQGSNVQAINNVAGQMQAFLASDVVYSQRVAPLIRQALDKNGISGQTIATSKFLPSIAWLDPGQVGDRLNPNAGVSQGAKPGQPKPGTHGHGLVSVKAGGSVLQPGGAVNRVTATAPLPIDVTFANQGQNNETNVKVVAKVTGGPRTLTATRTLNQTTAGSSATVTLQLTQVPPKGTSTTLTVTVQRVPGEKNTSNNSQSYIVLFN